MYRSSYGPTLDGLQKPELIAPSIWIPAPILPDNADGESRRAA
jgi:serine protease AprX